VELLDTYKSTNLKQLHCAVKHTPPSSAKVKNEWSYTSTPAVCLHGVDREEVYILSLTNFMTLKYSPFLHGNENTNFGHDMSLSHGGPQLMGRLQVADSEWPPDMMVSCE
jgi:hypothetical protein